MCMVFVFTDKVLRMAGERSVLASKHNVYKRQTLDQARTGPFKGSVGTTSPSRAKFSFSLRLSSYCLS